MCVLICLLQKKNNYKLVIKVTLVRESNEIYMTQRPEREDIHQEGSGGIQRGQAWERTGKKGGRENTACWHIYMLI